MKSKLYCIERTMKLYVKADNAEEAKECADYDETVYEEYTDSDPVEVPYVDTGIGIRLWPDDSEEDDE